ncbi:MAG: 50S ribosomal protein L33 [Sandaracinaceae bacterium]
MAERVRVALVCSECGARNYKTTRKKDGQKGERLTIKKFCKTCGRHTDHRESK